MTNYELAYAQPSMTVSQLSICDFRHCGLCKTKPSIYTPPTTI